MKPLTLSLGALEPKIAEQIQNQGYKFDKKEAQRFEKQKESIMHLYFGNIINDSEKQKMQVKLLKKVCSHLKLKNKQNENKRKKINIY